MLDLGWTELVVIAVVAILVVGPKDLPRMLRSFGKTMGQLRRSANEFKRQFDDALREAEREADFEDTRKSVQSIGGMNPLGDLKKTIETDIDSAGKAGAQAKRPPAKPAAKPADAAADGSAAAAGQAEGEAEPAKTAKAAAEPPPPQRDSDAA